MELNQHIGVFGNNISLSIKREDLLHPEISGNKFRKLKYNLEAAKNQGFQRLLTFGGAFSNHIAATAAAGNHYNFQAIGIIRGEELEQQKLNPTLSLAAGYGMKLHFINREDYRRKNDQDFINTLTKRFGPFYTLPEGGTNAMAVKGCEEILDDGDASFDYICCAVGTGGTIAGIIRSSLASQKILGFQVLQNPVGVKHEIDNHTDKSNFQIIGDYTFNGYAKINAELISFINSFYNDHKIPLDPVYTGKMVFGVMDMIKNGFFPDGSKVLMIHTGGLQGITGMNQILRKKNLPTIEVYG